MPSITSNLNVAMYGLTLFLTLFPSDPGNQHCYLKAMGLDASIYETEDCIDPIAEMRIGNAGLVAYLKDEIETIYPEARVLLEKVLYPGSHCGDVLEMSDVEGALKEIENIMSFDLKDEDLNRFISEFGSLARRAITENKPITF